SGAPRRQAVSARGTPARGRAVEEGGSLVLTTSSPRWMRSRGVPVEPPPAWPTPAHRPPSQPSFVPPSAVSFLLGARLILQSDFVATKMPSSVRQLRLQDYAAGSTAVSHAAGGPRGGAVREPTVNCTPTLPGRQEGADA